MTILRIRKRELQDLIFIYHICIRNHIVHFSSKFNKFHCASPFRSYVKRIQSSSDSIMFVFYLFIVLIVVVALSKGALGWTDTALFDGWCWISTCNTTISVNQQFAWMLMTNKMWEMLCAVFIVNIIFMGFCVRHRKVRN